MILDDYTDARDTSCLPQQGTGPIGMVQDIHNQHYVPACIRQRKGLAVEQSYRDCRSWAELDLYAVNGELWAPLQNVAREPAVATTNIENRVSADRNQCRCMRSEDVDSPREYQPVVKVGH